MPVLESQACSSCGRDNPAEAIFCTRCIAPLRIKKLADFDVEDFHTCVRALAETLNPPGPTAEEPRLDEDSARLLERYLNLHWLRPETALWQTLEARAVRRWQADYMREPLLDLGCGDGTHTAIMFGTRFCERFDVFASLRLDGPDIFDAFDPALYRPKIIEPGSRVSFGIDIRSNMVRRAGALDIYDRVLTGDATKLPLPDESVQTVYSNVLRDFPDETCRAALKEISRVLRPGGHLFLPACTPAWRDCLYFYPQARSLARAGDEQASRRMADLDRGRSVSFAQQKSPAQWSRRLESVGLEIIDTQPTHAREVARVWDVGLRPFAVPLLRWVNGLGPDDRLMVKRAIVRTITPPLTRLASIVPGNDCAHTMYLAHKS